MRRTWRWFGPEDRVTLADARQAGAEGIVTALHQLAPGLPWTADAVAERQAQIAEASGGALQWDVVESLPVSEGIKTKSPDWATQIDAYRRSMEVLAEAGIETICYNFMPVLDWTRTELRAPLPSGGTAMRFDLVDFAAFDIHILERPGAAESYPPDTAAAAGEVAARMNDS